MGILKQKSVMCLPWMRSILEDKLPHNPTLWLLSTARYAVLCVLSRFGRVQLCATLGTVASQAPLFMGFSRQEYWSGLPCPRWWRTTKDTEPNQSHQQPGGSWKKGFHSQELMRPQKSWEGATQRSVPRLPSCVGITGLVWKSGRVWLSPVEGTLWCQVRMALQRGIRAWNPSFHTCQHLYNGYPRPALLLLISSCNKSIG